ncbi:hypothetical protein VKS41_007399 [Umbelopsis sp. WA50703]
MFNFLLPRRQSSSTVSRPSHRRRRSDSEVDMKPSSHKSSLPPRPGFPSHRSYFLDAYVSFPSLEDDATKSETSLS